MKKNLHAALATLAMIALPLSAHADGWIVGAGSSTTASGTPQTSIGLAFESRLISNLSMVVRGDYDFQNAAEVYRSGVVALRVRAPMRIIHPWLEAGVGLGGNASTSEGGMAKSVGVGASASIPFGIEPFAEARIVDIANTPGASPITEFRVGGQIHMHGGE